MPCFSASTIRLANNQGVKRDRAKTARRGDSEKNLYSTRTVNAAQPLSKYCENLLRQEAYEALDANKHTHNGPKTSRKDTPKLKQTFLPSREFKRLQNRSKVVTLEDKLDALMVQEEENKRLAAEEEQTRKRFKEMDDARKRALEAKVEKEDLFGAGEKVKVLERAFLAKHEQEEEVKRVNRIIINAKCHAVRDAQVQEKNELQKNQRNIDNRLEKLVNEKALQGLNEEDKKFEQAKAEKIKYANEIRKQLNERENIRYLEAERIEEEAKMLRKANEAIDRDEARRAQLDKERRIKFRDELARIAEMSNLFKKMLCEQEREAEMRVAAYMREKEEQKRALLKEKKLAKEEKERQQDRLFDLAEKINESRSTREETDYLREKERIERRYRHQEKEAALRKRRIEKELAAAREKQLEETKHRQALHIARAEQDFKNLVARLKAEEAKEEKLNCERQQKRGVYRNDIIRQMGDKEMERRRLLDLDKSHAFALRESERQRDANIRDVINAKLAAMRDACLPEKYIKDVVKQLEKIAKK